MCKKILSLCAFMLLLSSCTTFDSTSGAASGEEYVGWHCEGDINLSDQWKCTEKLMVEGEPVVEEQKPQPESEPRLSDSSASQTPEKGSNEQPVELIVEQAVEQKVTQSLQQPVEKTFDISADGYTVQLGAYLNQAMAERSADKIVLGGGDLRVRDIISEGQYRFVIVYGQYQTRPQAQASAERLAVLNPQLDYWVRTIKSMRDGS